MSTLRLEHRLCRMRRLRTISAATSSTPSIAGTTRVTRFGASCSRRLDVSGADAVLKMVAVVVAVLTVVAADRVEAVEMDSNMTILEKLITRGRCQARCNQLYGHQERQRQIDLFDHYLPYVCRQGNDFNCTECSKACVGDSLQYHHTCKQRCKSDVCRDSCDFLRDAYTEEDYEQGPSVKAWNLPPAARKLILTKPRAICTYTHVQMMRAPHTSVVRLSWNVRDVTEYSTSVALSFVMAITKCPHPDHCPPKHAQWTFFMQTTNYSVIPIYDLQPATTYVIKVLAVHWSGYVSGSMTSDPITTPASHERLGTPIDLSVSKQYVRAGKLHAVVSWRAPPETGGCFFRLYSMPPKGTFEMMEIEYWGQLKYELKKLTFNSNYTIQVYNSDERFIVHSKPANITFATLNSCLEATNYDYNLCPPEKPANVNLSGSSPYVLNNTDQELCDILVTWDPPKYRRHRNFVSNYSLAFRKAPDMHNADVIVPHRGMLYLPASATNYTIRKCHWDGIYEVTMRAQSRGGRSEEVTVAITLGNGYADFYDSAETEVEDKAVLYATAAPVLLGLLAVVVCLLYRWRINSSKGLVLGESLRREEINPIYEHAVGKAGEEEGLLAADEYEMDYSALHVTDTIGEGAFGKVLKANLDLSIFSVDGRSSGTKTVAVKMLKEHATPDERRNLLLEIEAMKQLGQHQNIVSIIACVTCAKRPCLVMHYCQLGDLSNFLRRHRKKASKDHSRSQSRSSDRSTNSGRRGAHNSADSGISYASIKSHSQRLPEGSQGLATSEDGYGAVGGVHRAASYSGSASPTDSSDNSGGTLLGEGDKEGVSQTKLLSFARQIAMGMEYLAERKFIHRDLAARNILLYNHRQLKISDFGLARDVYETSMYQPTSARKLPYKWMPIESIFDQVFTIKSDVWSFGIVLWEIVTLGGCPYPGIPNKDLFCLLKEGYRMEKPENCSPEIYKMMLSCWHPRPEDRPSFTDLRMSLEGSLEKSQSYIDLSVAVSEDYYKHDSGGSVSDHLAPFGSNRLSVDDGGRGSECSSSTSTTPATATVSAAADVHVCQLFHNNSSDKNLTPSVAEAIISEAPVSDEEKQSRGWQTADPTPSENSGPIVARKIETGSGDMPLKPKAFRTREKNGSGLGGALQEMEDELMEEYSVREECNNLLSLSGSAPLLPNYSCSGRSSSSTDLTCDCESPDNLSDTSVSSGRSHSVKVHHAPSLTYGILSLLRAGKGLPPRKGHSGQRRHSRSLTDVNRLEMELDDFDRDLSSCAHATVVRL